jgi:hypothetical protein
MSVELRKMGEAARCRSAPNRAKLIFEQGQEGFGNLLRNPFRRRMCCHIEPDKLSPRQPDNDQNVEQIEGNGRNHEQIHRCDM